MKIVYDNLNLATISPVQIFSNPFKSPEQELADIEREKEKEKKITDILNKAYEKERKNDELGGFLDESYFYPQ